MFGKFTGSGFSGQYSNNAGQICWSAEHAGGGRRRPENLLSRCSEIFDEQPE
jgi:hypothetical protein